MTTGALRTGLTQNQRMIMTKTITAYKLLMVMLFALPCLAADTVTVTNARKTGPEQETIIKTLVFIQSNMDDKCAAVLPNVNQMITALMGDPSDERTVLIGHADFGKSTVAAFTGNDSISIIGLPEGYAMTVNDRGAFFTSVYAESQVMQTSNGFKGGTAQAKVLILLHELGHFTHSPSFIKDFDNWENVKHNVAVVLNSCKSIIKAAKREEL